MSGSYHNDNYIVKFAGLWREQFIIDEPHVYFLPQYTEEKISKRRKSYIFHCTGLEAAHYLASMTLYDLQNITIFSSKFDWAIDLFEDTVLGHKDDMDVLVYVKRPSRPSDEMFNSTSKP